MPIVETNLAATPVIEITGLRKSFGTNAVLKGIDLAVSPGEVIAIIGKAALGKVPFCVASTAWRIFKAVKFWLMAKPWTMPAQQPCASFVSELV